MEFLKTLIRFLQKPNVVNAIKNVSIYVLFTVGMLSGETDETLRVVLMLLGN